MEPLTTSARVGNYAAQNNGRPLTRRQVRQVERASRHSVPLGRVEGELKHAEPKGVTLPELGAIDPHNLALIQMGHALHRTGKHVYGGTVPSATIGQRRRANKSARVARRAGRR